MKKLITFAVVCIVLMFGGRMPQASGPVGIYGIVEKVVFEPNEQAPERIQVWGAFAYADGALAPRGAGDRALSVSQARRGYLYFKLPAVIPGFTEQSQVEAAKREWADLKAVAGTGQAIAFGSWGYIGGFAGLDPATGSNNAPHLLERAPRGGQTTDMHVRPASEAPASPATYQTNAGIVKLSADGSHAAIVKQLRETLKNGR
jgi:hypothetical protein